MKASCRVFSGVCLLCALLFPAVSGAADFSVGASVWYAWYNENQIDNSDPSVDPTFLYGPMFALGFAPRWSLTAVFLYGVYDYPMTPGETEPLRRYDSDIALNYSINRYIKVFGGAKVMGYAFDQGSYYGAGPALGLGLTLPLSDSLFLLGNVSGVYGFGREEHDGGSSSDARELGFNTTFSLAYYIESASTTITLGGRYQWFNIDYEKDDPNEFPESNITFYGITFSVVYSFEL